MRAPGPAQLPDIRKIGGGCPWSTVKSPRASGTRQCGRRLKSSAVGQIEPPLVPMPRRPSGAAIQLQGPEFRLRVGQYVFDRGKLHQVAGIARAERQAFPSIHHRPAQTQTTAAMPSSKVMAARDKNCGERTPRKSPDKTAPRAAVPDNLLEESRHLFPPPVGRA